MILDDELARLVRREIIGFKDDNLPEGRSIPFLTNYGKTMWAHRRKVYMHSETLEDELICDLIEIEEPTPNRFRKNDSIGVYGTIMFRIGDLHFLLNKERDKLGNLSADNRIILLNEFEGSLGYYMIQKYSATVLAAQIYLSDLGILANQNVLILGSSDGPQALAGIKLGAPSALCVDISADEGRYMRKHVMHNGLEKQIDFLQGDVSHPYEILKHFKNKHFRVIVSNLGNHYPGTEEGTIAIASTLGKQEKITLVLGGYAYNVDFEYRHLSSRKILKRLDETGFKVKADFSYGPNGVIAYILQN